MATGDGLLARLVPSGRTIGLDAFAGLCSAARSHGNGIVEVTSRGSIQVRGLSTASTPAFVAFANSVEIDCGDVIPVLTHPLSGLDPEEKIDVGALVDNLRGGLASFASRLSAKVSVILDGGGSLLPLDEVSADVRLRAVNAADGLAFHVALGGDASGATPLGAVPPDRIVECVIRLLGVLAGMAPHSRVRDTLRDGGLAPFESAISGLVVRMPQPPAQRPVQPIGVHPLRDGHIAIGIGLPFGHSDAETLTRLIDGAKRAGASGVRTAPGRALLLVGLSPEAAADVRTQAGRLGFIVEPSDPRCKVIACAGSPVCASGQIPSRSLAAALAQAVQTGSCRSGDYSRLRLFQGMRAPRAHADCGVRSRRAL